MRPGRIISAGERIADLILEQEPLLLAVAIPILVFPPSYLLKWQRGQNNYAPLGDVKLTYPDAFTYLALGLIIFPWLLRLARRGYLTLRTPLDGPMALYLLSMGLGLWPSVDRAHSLETFLGLGAGVALYYGVVNWGSGRIERVRLLIVLLLGGATLFAAFSLLQMDWGVQPVIRYPALFQPLYTILARLPHWGPKLVNISVAAGTLIIVAPLGLCLLFAPMRRPYKFLVLISQTVIVGYVIFGWSRGDILALALTAMVMLGLASSRGMPVLLAGGIGALLAGLLAFRWFPVTPLDVLAQIPPSRWEVWTRALYMIKDYPFSGVGLDTFRIIARNNYPYFNHAFDQTEHAHNFLLQAGVDGGSLGLLALLWLIVAFYFTGWRALNRALAATQTKALNPKLHTLAFIGAFTAFLISGAFDNGVMTSARTALVVWITLGLAMSLWRMEKKRARFLPFSLSRGQWMGVSLIAAGGILIILSVAYPTLASAGQNNLGNVYRDRGYYTAGLADEERGAFIHRAVAHWQQAIELNPHNGLAHRNLGVIYYRVAEEWQDAGGHRPWSAEYQPLAIFHLLTATQQSPGDLFAHLFLAEAHRVQGSLGEAAREYVMAGAPVEYVIGEGRRRWDGGRGDYGAAVAQLTIATLMDPHSAEAYYALGLCHQGQKAYRAAMQAYEMALQIDPQHQSVRRELDKLRKAQ